MLLKKYEIWKTTEKNMKYGKLLCYLALNSMEQSPYWEANSHSTS